MDFDVFGILRVVAVSHRPGTVHKHTSWFQYSSNLLVDINESTSMAGGLEAEDAIKGVVLKLHVTKITLLERQSWSSEMEHICVIA